jgi:septum site-determining protein MinC
MAARLIPAPASGWLHRLVLGQVQRGGDASEMVRHALGADPPSGGLELDCGDWTLGVTLLARIAQQLQAAGLILSQLRCRDASTFVAGSAQGWRCVLDEPATGSEPATAPPVRPVHVHRGTIRSGEQIEVEGALLVVGDVNPGARVSASGDVLIWGRLRGMAHAGCRGERAARIVALQLRPVQLRIADAVARGPEDPPPLGVTEQAQLVENEIQISPAELGRPLIAG